jgi:hypothetical protein
MKDIIGHIAREDPARYDETLRAWEKGAGVSGFSAMRYKP